mmetsp:Transcript_51883/g.110243  ORF Transcript_51883/g.110243 Transcript_51883/m.110243 type:complete len:234 (-) Transcript_51883:75-776(-)
MSDLKVADTNSSHFPEFVVLLHHFPDFLPQPSVQGLILGFPFAWPVHQQQVHIAQHQFVQAQLDLLSNLLSDSVSFPFLPLHLGLLLLMVLSCSASFVAMAACVQSRPPSLLFDVDIWVRPVQGFAQSIGSVGSIGVTDFCSDPDIGSSQLALLESLTEAMSQDALRVVEEGCIEMSHTCPQSSRDGTPSCLWFEAHPLGSVSPVAEGTAIAQDGHLQAILQLQSLFHLDHWQ